MKWRTLPASKLEGLIKAGKRIFVLNTSSLPSGDKGMIVVNFYDGTRREFFKMPPTFIPMAISDSIPAKKLGESRDFKECLLKGMLTLVDPDQAESYLESDEAQNEYENLVLADHSVKAKRQELETQIMKRSKVVHQTSESAGPMDVQDVSAIDTISNRVRALVESMISGTKAAEEVVIELRRHQTALTAVDLSYVLGNSTDSRLSKWTEKAIKDLASKPSAAVKPVAKKAKKEALGADADFSFDDEGDDLSAEEKAADDAARARAMASQDLEGRGSGGATKAIDEILKGR